MKLRFNNTRVQVEDATTGEEAWLFDFLSFADGSNTYRKRERFRVFDMVEHTFPVGNLGAVVRGYAQVRELAANERPKWFNGAKLGLVDERVKPCEAKPNPALAWLYWYQREAVEICVKRGRGIVKVPTAGGKTEIAIGLQRTLPCRWLFVAHRAQLMNNGAERWELRERERLEGELARLRVYAEHAADAGKPIDPDDLEAEIAELEEMIADVHAGRFGDSIDDVRPTDKIIFATFQGMHAALAGRGGELARWAQGVIIDECHVQPAATFYAVTQACVNAYFRIGLSGTPLQRGDKRNVLAVGALGKMLYKIRVKTLIDEGVYAYPRMRFVECDQSSEIPAPVRCPTCKGSGTIIDAILEEPVDCMKCKGRGEIPPKYAAVYKHGIVESKIRERLSVQIAKQQAKPGMVFVEKLDHGKRLKRAFERAGLNIVFVDGKKKTKQRDQALLDLKRGHFDLVLTTRVMQEGINVPSLASVFNAGAGRSPIGVLQRMGRGARTTATKTEFEYWDILDKGRKNLRDQANARKKAMADETECPVEVLPDAPQLSLA